MKADDMKMLSAVARLGVRVPQGCCLDVKRFCVSCSTPGLHQPRH